ncbi:16S rRNA (cytosine(1402)-N(4))-methyltransferase RsmH [bacterium]|nr:16S rRNA (cytosine(1402)-N(4))-methyltransferase RsmH [bacterium]
MVKEVLELLVYDKAGTYVDATVGGGGHSEAIIRILEPEGRLIGIDKDEEALKYTNERLRNWKDRITFIHGNFSSIKALLKRIDIDKVNGMLFDLGVSSYQIETPERGFSFSKDGPLDMRMDKNQAFEAKTVINEYNQKQLARIFYTYGEERFANKIAKEIVEYRKTHLIESTMELVNIIKGSIKVVNINKVLARVFQSIRIAVNSELENLDNILDEVLNTLVPGGQVCFISYHSLEDRRVKRHFKLKSQNCICPPSLPECRCNHKKEIEILTPRGIRPSKHEIELNPKSRSAILRAAKKI